MAINILITDDHSMIREGLKNLLELDGDIKVIAEAENGEDCLDKLKTFRPDVLLLDINMPKMNGLEVLKALKDRKSKVKVLVLTVHNETEYLMKAVDIGRILSLLSLKRLFSLLLMVRLIYSLVLFRLLILR